MFSARIYAAHSVFKHAYTVKIWHFMIRRIDDCALSSALFSQTIPLLYDVTRGSPDDEFQEFIYQNLSLITCSLRKMYLSVQMVVILNLSNYCNEIFCIYNLNLICENCKFSDKKSATITKIMTFS